MTSRKAEEAASESHAVNRELQETSAEADRTGAPSEELQPLKGLHQLLFQHPAATQAIFNALVAEGTAYAKTEAGADLRARLLRSDWTARARMVWDVVSMSTFSAKEKGLPSVIINELAKMAATSGLERKLSALFSKEI